MTLGAKIRKERLARDWTQEQLGDRCRVSAMTVSRWEDDKMTPRTRHLRRLIEVLETTWEELVESDKDEQKTDENRLSPQKSRELEDAVEEVRALGIRTGLRGDAWALFLRMLRLTAKEAGPPENDGPRQFRARKAA